MVRSCTIDTGDDPNFSINNVTCSNQILDALDTLNCTRSYIIWTFLAKLSAVEICERAGRWPRLCGCTDDLAIGCLDMQWYGYGKRRG
jgi:hypothetical protein